MRVVGNGTVNGSGDLVAGSAGNAPAWVQLPTGGLAVDGSGAVKASTGPAPGTLPSGGQILQQTPQVIAQPGPGGTITYNVLSPPFQTLSIDGQDAIFIPSGGAPGGQTLLGNQTILSTPTRQLVSAQPATNPNVAAFGNLGNMVNIGGNLINLASLQNAQRPGMIQTVQLPLQQQVQQIPNIIQIPISNGQGGQTMQTIQLPLQSFGGNAYQTAQLQGAVALQGGATISAAQLGANAQGQAQITPSSVASFLQGSQPQQVQIQQQSQAGQSNQGEIKLETTREQPSVVVLSNETKSTTNAETTTNTSSPSTANQATAVNQLMVAQQQSDSPASSQAQQAANVSQVNQAFANQSQAFPTFMPLTPNFINSPQTILAPSLAGNTNTQNVLSFAVASVPGVSTTNTTTTSTNASTTQPSQSILTPQLFQSLGAQGFGNFQLTSNGQIIATQNQAFMPALNVANLRPAGAGMQAIQLQNIQGLQNLQAIPTLQNLQNLQTVQALNSQQILGGATLQNFALANAGNNTIGTTTAQLPQLSPQQLQMQAIGTQQAAIQQTQQALGNPQILSECNPFLSVFFLTPSLNTRRF